MTLSVYEVLQGLGIAYTLHEHEAAFTVEQARRIYGHLPGAHCKNLFLRNKKGDRHYLAVVEAAKRVDLRALRQALGERSLTLASPERLLAHLRLTPGSVTPFGLIHDTARAVRVVVDQDLLREPLLNFHPDRNTATLAVSGADFRRFLAHCGNEVRVVEIPA
jgi:Ala-tRNA(Pro) deacylase